MVKEKLEKQLMAELSRRNTDFIVHWAQNQPGAIKELVEMVLSHQEVVASRAAWVLEKLSGNYSGLLDAHIPKIIKSLSAIPSSSTRRTIAKVLMFHQIPEESEGELLDFCLRMIEAAKEPVAVKANCMTLVFSLLPKYPELKNEIFALIENQIPYSSPAIYARYHVLKRKHFPEKTKKKLRN
ncbi:MAG TPA: hypothetical protein DCY97_13470 [Marinilabiliales bacterium]|nr:hypothetical protein [Marinilabiliales bacterium]